MTRFTKAILVLVGIGASAIAFGVKHARAAEGEKPRQWRIEVCTDTGCEFRGAALSGPTACNVDLASLANVLPKASRLACVRIGETKR